MEIYPDCDLNRWAICCTTQLADAANYYTKAQVDEKIVSGGGISSGEVQTMIDESVSGKVDSSDFEAFSASTYTALDNKLDASAYTPTDLSDYYTKEETNSQISSATADMATETWVGNQGYITGVDLSNYATLSDIPTSNSGLTNDAGYATSGYVDSAVSGKADTSAVTADINAAVSGKQDTLSAGTNINITNNVISATDTTYSAGNGIAIVSNEISLDLPLYKGSNDYAVSIGNITGTAQGANQVKGTFSAAIGGGGLITNNSSEVAIGRYNVSTTAQSVTYGSSAKTSFSVGNGSGSNNKHNSFEIKENGDIYFADTNNSADYYSKPMIKLQDAIDSKADITYVDSATTVAGETNIVYNSPFNNSYHYYVSGDSATTVTFNLGSSSNWDVSFIGIESMDGNFLGFEWYELPNITIDDDYPGATITVTGSSIVVTTPSIIKYIYFEFDNINTLQSFVTVKPSNVPVTTALGGVTTALGGLKFVKLTQSAYDALSPNYDANTIYFIKD